MATLVCFHAHPDDEAIATGGTMIKAVEAGHQVVLVTATRGEQGEPVPGILREGEPLWERRVAETHRAAEILGVGRVEFLGYEDSGMIGEPTNDNPNCFWQADLGEAAERLAAILRDVSADVVTIYDDNGVYGHPDHIQVHRVGLAAARLAGIDRIYQGTMNRDLIMRTIDERAGTDEGVPDDLAERRKQMQDNPFGKPERELTHAIDVGGFIDTKREAMVAHASQIGDDSFFLQMPPELFLAAFGREWFIRYGATRPDGAAFSGDLFADVG